MTDKIIEFLICKVHAFSGLEGPHIVLLLGLAVLVPALFSPALFSPVLYHAVP